MEIPDIDGLVVRSADGREHIMPVSRYRNEPARPRLQEPEMGEHNALLRMMKKKGNIKTSVWSPFDKGVLYHLDEEL